jgi:hypothetical protein
MKIILKIISKIVAGYLNCSYLWCKQKGKNIMKTTEQLNKEFAKLNKKYIALDKSLNGASELEAENIGDQMEAIQTRMSEIATQLEG